MAHIHSVYDTDKHFTIDPFSRELVNQTPDKAKIMQFDHDSERITFDLPATVEGHNTMDCNVVEVHYLNIDAQTKLEKSGLYKVNDLQLSQADPTVAICSWLISRNATQLVGPLYFRITFKCVSNDDDLADYVWSTAIYKGLSVSDGIDTSSWIAEEYADLVAEWERRISSMETRVKDIEMATAVGTVVRTVNGARPDEQGNVQIVIPECELPDVTEADENLMLQVVGGAWTPVDPTPLVVAVVNSVLEEALGGDY